MSMGIAQSDDKPRAFLRRVLTTDFCPSFNRYVYWLKEPIGWFALAGIVCVLVGLYVSPIGWMLAAGIAAIVAVGLAFPWLAVRTARCHLKPLMNELHEHEPSVLQLRVSNRLPIPLWGLTVEGYLTGNPSGLVEAKPELALGAVAPLSRCLFRLPITPEFRGHFPVVKPVIACAFPFGIWTARRQLEDVEPVTVWPMRIAVENGVEFRGTQWAEVGDGNRTGGNSDFLGVRPFRRGDSLRSVHWVQSARQDALIVCERSAPEKTTLAILLDTSPTSGTAEEIRDHLAWRVRIINSLLVHFHAHHIHTHLVIDGKQHVIAKGAPGLRSIGNVLAGIPLMPSLDKVPTNDLVSLTGGRPSGPSITIAPHHRQSNSRFIMLRVQFAATSLRDRETDQQFVIDLQGDIAWQLNQALCEVSHARQVA